ncbi:MAG: hypothetical protein IKW03_01875 [Clostridia bacterium]|nr:hypothetical protein [Clostridia bacterium]
MKKLSITPKLVSRKGSGRINDDIPVDFMEYAIPQSDEIKQTEEQHIVPDEIKVSEQIHGIVYDVTGVFDGKLNKSLLQQFKEIILSEQLS